VVNKEQLKTLLTLGRQVKTKEYCGRCGIHHIKTFYFFCRRLSLESQNTALPSTDLNDYILFEVKEGGFPVKETFNPHGWFGKAWTDWDRSEGKEPSKLFRPEYCDVLLRTREKPYSYQVRPQYFDLVKGLFSEFAGGH
jgi:hypothetical protein